MSTLFSPPLPRSAVNPPRTLRVYLAGDRPGAFDPLAAEVRAAGYHVNTAADHASALADVLTFHPDLVVVAIDAPGGLELVEAIQTRAAWRKPLIVAVTGHGDPDAYRRARDAGVHLYVEAPVVFTRLRGLLARFSAVLSGIESFDPVI